MPGGAGPGAAAVAHLSRVDSYVMKVRNPPGSSHEFQLATGACGSGAAACQTPPGDGIEPNGAAAEDKTLIAEPASPREAQKLRTRNGRRDGRSRPRKSDPSNPADELSWGERKSTTWQSFPILGHLPACEVAACFPRLTKTLVGAGWRVGGPVASSRAPPYPGHPTVESTQKNTAARERCAAAAVKAGQHRAIAIMRAREEARGAQACGVRAGGAPELQIGTRVGQIADIFAIARAQCSANCRCRHETRSPHSYRRREGEGIT